MLSASSTYSPGSAAPKGQIPCYDPSTMQFLGYAKAMTPAQVRRLAAAADSQQQEQQQLCVTFVNITAVVYRSCGAIDLLCVIRLPAACAVWAWQTDHIASLDGCLL